jgi:hypothetical protein
MLMRRIIVCQDQIFVRSPMFGMSFCCQNIWWKYLLSSGQYQRNEIN